MAKDFSVGACINGNSLLSGIDGRLISQRIEYTENVESPVKRRRFYRAVLEELKRE